MRRDRNFYDERGLLYLDTVIQHGGIRKASAVLHVSPSAISRQIKLLEERLSAPLLVNVGRKMSLTPVGHCVVRYIEKIKAAENDLVSEISEVQNFEVGHIRIASGGGFITPLVNGVIREFNDRYPGISYRLDIVSGETVSKMIARDEADIGFVFNCETEQKQFCIKSLPCGDIKLVSKRNSRFKINSDSRTCLSQLPLVMLKPGFTIYTAAEQVLHSLGIETYNQVIECDSFNALIEAVKSDLGVTLLPKFCVTAALEEQVLETHDLPLPQEQSQPFLSILATDDRYASPLLKNFTDTSQEYFSERFVL